MAEGWSLLSDLDAKLTSLFEGTLSPYVLTPADLSHLLHEIADNLPSILKLPFDTETELHLYYQYLECSVFADKLGFTVVLAIPLKDVTSLLDLFKVVPFKIPYTNLSVMTNYELDYKFIAVSPNRSEISFVQDWDIYQCASRPDHFCHIVSPIYNVHAIQGNCIIKLFLRDPRADSVCPIRVKQ